MMMLTRNAAIVSMIGLLLSLTGSADAARIKAKAKQSHVIHGLVVSGKNKPVRGARVHVAHHHKKAAVGKAVAKGKAKAHAHHGIVSASDGTFTMKHHHAGTITLEAHKKGVGSGHARVKVGKSANVTIRLGKHHHHHSK